MDYINDVFISYKRGRINEQWLETIFIPHFYDYLNELLPHNPKIFVDKKGLTPGVDFGDDLFNNLVYSKSFVSIWSPLYFRRSEWCVKEFLTMNYQQQLYGIDTSSRPQTLIFPILLKNLIDPIPSMVKRMHSLDYSEFNIIGEAFFLSPLYLKFQTKLQNDVNLIAEIINNAPPLHDDLKTPDGKKKIEKEINTYLLANSSDFDLPNAEFTSW
jgi:hypothetical protein